MKSISMMKNALGENFSELPEIIRRHYDFTDLNQKLVIYGEMLTINHNAYAKVFIFFGRFIKALVPFKGVNIPTVLNATCDASGTMFWNRNFDFGQKGKVVFNSKMISYHPNEIIEYIGFGLGVKMKVSFENDILLYTVKHYVQNIFGLMIPIPSFFVLGGGYIKNYAVDADHFRIDFKLSHPLFGETFGYTGVFSVKTEIK